MPDIADIANDLAQWRLDLVLNAHKQSPVFESLTLCMDCNLSIPMARRLAAKGCKRCADCQVINEKQGTLHAR